MGQNLILMMSLAGTITYLLYLLTYPITKKQFTARWRYRILKIILAFFLIPFQYYKYIIIGFFEMLFPFIKEAMESDSAVFIIENYNVVLKYNGMIFLSENIKQMWISAAIIGVISCIIIIVQIVKYIKMKNIFLQKTRLVSPSLLNRVDHIKANMGMKASVKIIISEYCFEPMVVGVFKPMIVLPPFEENTEELERLELIFKHELTHIKNRDLLIRFTALLVMAIHWFNPICYFIFRELCNMGEICCDADLLKNCNTEEIKKYLNTLVYMASESKLLQSSLFSVGLINSNTQMLKRKISIFVCLAFCVIGGTTIFAYDPPTILNYQTSAPVDLNPAGEFIEGEEIREPLELPLEEFFVDQHGNAFEVSITEPSSKAACAHNLIEGIYKKHTLKSDGSCQLAYYHSTRCTKCEYVAIGEKYNTQRNDKCPH